MGQCSSSQQPEAEKVRQQPAEGVDCQKRQEQQRKATAAAHMNQPYRASTHDELVLMMSLDSISKIMWNCRTADAVARRSSIRHQWRLPRWTSPCLLLLYKRRMLRPLFVISLYIEFTSKTKIPKRSLLAALQKLVCSSHVSPSVRQGNVFQSMYTLKNSHEGTFTLSLSLIQKGEPPGTL